MNLVFPFALCLALFVGCEQPVAFEIDINDASPSQSAMTTPVSRPASAIREGKTREFKFVYGAALTDLKPGTKVRVWLPVATSNHDQQVELMGTDLPAQHRRTVEKRYGNALIYFEAEANEAGEVPIEVTYRVTRRELTDVNYENATDDGTMFLKASTLVPTDTELRDQVLGNQTADGDSLEMARKLYEGVDEHMKYDKPSDQPGWGNGDAVWACNNGFGNCTDFHSLFIASARTLEIPARFEIGFPIPQKIGKGVVGGYHCWAKFLADGKWVPVDISEADKNPALKDYYFGNLTPDRVQFSIGRDLELTPAPAAGTVNYLSYPYAEVNGKQHKSFRKAFRYEDVASKDPLQEDPLQKNGLPTDSLHD